MSTVATGRRTSTTPTASPRHGRRIASSGASPTVAALPCDGSAVVMTQHGQRLRSDIILSSAHTHTDTMLRPNSHSTTGQLSSGDGGLKGTCPVNGGAGSGEHSPSHHRQDWADSGLETRTPTPSEQRHSIARTGDRQHATERQACGRHSDSPATTEHSTPSAVSRGFFCRVGVAERNQKR